ncbi:MAG: DUF1631 domain-containing protein [Pseudomonadota bacterium]|nr:DUF1631 domain-containing protein [Pseudomonadota bacterium]
MLKNPFGVGYATQSDPLRVLEEIQRRSVEQLGGVPGALFSPVEAMLNPALDRDEPAQYVDQSAFRLLRQRHSTHVMNYRQQVARGFDIFRARRARAPDRSEPLGLVDEAALELHLAGQRLAASIQQRYARPLALMDGRLRALGLELGLPQAPNPVGPARLSAAFLETFGEEPIPGVLRTLLFRQYEIELERVLGSLYGKINSILSENGYAVADAKEQIPAEPESESAIEEESRARDAAAAAERQLDAPDEPRQGSLSELRGMLHAWRENLLKGEGADQGTAATSPQPGQRPTGSHMSGSAHSTNHKPARARRELRVEELVSVASLLQSEPTDTFARALAGSGRLANVIRDHLNFGSRRLGLDPDQLSFSTDEEDAIDLIALLFDTLFQSHRLPERSRRLYARLVLPFIKVALTDASLFEHSAHPARQLLDAITEACAGNAAETPQERELLERAAAASQRIVTEFNEDLEIFKVAHAELDALLQQQRRRVELQAERAAQATSGRERLSLAREQADAILAEQLASTPLSEAIAEFLSTPWRYHLVQTLLREGEVAQPHVEARALGDALVDVDKLAAQGAGHLLADHLIQLQPAIVACLASSGLDSTAAEHGLAMLVRGLAHPHTPRNLHPVPSLETPSDDAAERRLWLVGGTDTVPVRDPALVERMRKLRIGDVLQMVDAQGERVPAKVAWVSPLTTRLLLVNRRGVRLLFAAAEELAELAENGRLELGEESTPFDEALRDIRQRLAQGQR